MSVALDPASHAAGGWLVTDGVRHAFPGDSGADPLPVLDDVSLHVDRGELVALVGPSGCGKSTLLSIIAGLLTPATGTIRLGGRDTTGATGHVAYMMQDDLLLPWRTVLGNVVLGPELVGMPAQRARERAIGLMQRFELAGFEDFYPSALSGGMRQRVAFMRTVLCDKDVLLLDEPFSGIDALNRSRLHEWLLDIWHELGLTILFITHDPEEAVFLSDRTYVLSSRPGRVSEVVTIDLPRPRRHDVVGSPRFAALKQAVLERLWQDAPTEPAGAL